MERSAPAAQGGSRGRIAFFDTLRGFTIVSMVCFHAAYDAAYLYGIDMPWFAGTVFQAVWRASISWVFLLLAGWMTSLSHSNLRRGAVYAAAAAAVWAATSIASVDTAITFGILFCMAASTLLYAAARPVLDHVPPEAGLAVFLIAFVLTLGVPQTRYAFGGLAWLGFPGPGFSSGDYYPMIPYTFLYLAGAMAARLFGRLRASGYPAWMKRDLIPPLTALGKHSLIVYLVHQPLLIVLFDLLTG